MEFSTGSISSSQHICANMDAVCHGVCEEKNSLAWEIGSFKITFPTASTDSKEEHKVEEKGKEMDSSKTSEMIRNSEYSKDASSQTRTESSVSKEKHDNEKDVEMDSGETSEMNRRSRSSPSKNSSCKVKDKVSEGPSMSTISSEDMEYDDENTLKAMVCDDENTLKKDLVCEEEDSVARKLKESCKVKAKTEDMECKEEKSLEELIQLDNITSTSENTESSDAKEEQNDEERVVEIDSGKISKTSEVKRRSRENEPTPQETIEDEDLQEEHDDEGTEESGSNENNETSESNGNSKDEPRQLETIEEEDLQEEHVYEEMKASGSNENNGTSGSNGNSRDKPRQQQEPTGMNSSEHVGHRHIPLDFQPCSELEMIDVTSEKNGAKIIFATDDYYGVAKNLIKNDDPICNDQTIFSDNNDGWKTQKLRKEETNFVIIQLFGEAEISTICIDTACFIDSINVKFSLQGGRLPKSLTDSILKTWENKLCEPCYKRDYKNMCDITENWPYLVPTAQLNPGYPSISKKFFKIDPKETTVVTHLRLNIYPDGGIARLRTYGRILLPITLTPNDEIELSSNLYNSYCTLFNDHYIGHPNNIIQPNEMADRCDGWLTVDRTANESFNTEMSFDQLNKKWAVFKLGIPGIITRIVIDTRGFIGNAPYMIRVEKMGWEDTTNLCVWHVIAQDYINPGTEQIFYMERQFFTRYIKITILPDGGISRFRVFGTPIEYCDC